MAQHSEFTAGQVIAERYQLVSLLGAGGMGSVWRARHLVRGNQVALKLVNLSLTDVPHIKERFMREAQALSSLDSPYLVHVLDFGVEGGVPYLAMELLEGESLAAKLSTAGRISPAMTSRIVEQVSAGLGRAHDAGIVHRDIKPANIFLVRDGDDFVARLIDFGLAKTSEPTGLGLTLTETGAVLGTPNYMSPEQVAGSRHVDHRSDLWSLGVIAFECITGVRPFRGQSMGSVFLSICVEAPPVPSAVAVVPKGFDDWFRRAVHRNLEQRFQSAAELAAELSLVCAGVELAGTESIGTEALEDEDAELMPTVEKAKAKPLTLLALTIDGEPLLMQRLGDDYPRAVAQLQEHVTSVARVFGGMVVQSALGSAVVVFSDAREAVEAALELQRLISQTEWPQGLLVRAAMALHSCRRIMSETGLSPEDLRLARNICSVGHGGQVLVSEPLQATLAGKLPDGLNLIDLGQHELDVEAGRRGRLFQLSATGLTVERAPLRTPGASPHNLPLETSEFIGRTDELRRLHALCSESRLVTLVGPGGVGKSRLALRAAAELSQEFSDGTYFFPLAALRDPELVVSTVAGILGVPEHGERSVIEALLKHLENREILLLLDNFEHILAAASDLSRMMEVAPRSKFLVTSRVVLHLAGEQVFEVPPLSLPQTGATSLEALVDNESVELFVARACRVDSSFELTEGNADSVAEIVRRLDGLPLAIELAAARIKVFPPSQLARQLKHKQTTLHDASGEVVGRHRVLHDVVAWSHSLLAEEEQALFRRLAVFEGGLTVQSAEHVTSGRPVVDVPAGLRSLADKSLLRREIHDGVERLVMLEFIREFAERELEKTDELAPLRARHARFFSELAADAEPELKREGSIVARDRLAREDANLRAALEFYLREGNANDGLGIAAGIWRYWQSAGRLQEGRRWLAELLACPGTSLSLRARGLTAIAGLAYWQADYSAAQARYRDALEIYRELGDRLAIGETLFALSTTATWSGDSAQGEALAQDALALFDELGAREQIGMVKMAQGFARWMKGDLPGARPLWETSIAIAREVGDNVEAAHKSVALASILFQEGSHEEAIRRSCDAMDELFARRNVALTAMAIEWIASMVVDSKPLLSARLAGASAELRRSLGGGMKPEACGLPSVRAVASMKVGEESFEREFKAGRRMDLAEAVELARGLRKT